jgi:tetratricopeptide (TPR) repeat protein
MRRLILMLALVAAALWTAPVSAQSRSQLGPLCTTETTPADQQIDACNKIIALKVSPARSWRRSISGARSLEQEGNFSQVISDAGEALRLRADVALYNLRGSAYYDKGEYDIAIADFNDAIRIGPPSGIVFHNRGNAFRSRGDYAKAIADYDQAIKLGPKDAFTYQNRSSAKQALGDLDGALADINEAIRLNPALPSPLNNRTVIWRAKGDFDRAIADGTEAIRLAKAKAPVNVMTPPGSVLISAYIQRGLAYEAKGDYEHARQDFYATLEGVAADANSKANQATAKVRLSLLSDAAAPSPPPQTRRQHRRLSRSHSGIDAVLRPAPATSTNTGLRVALVIGNGAYAHAWRAQSAQ